MSESTEERHAVNALRRRAALRHAAILVSVVFGCEIAVWLLVPYLPQMSGATWIIIAGVYSVLMYGGLLLRGLRRTPREQAREQLGWHAPRKSNIPHERWLWIGAIAFVLGYRSLVPLPTQGVDAQASEATGWITFVVAAIMVVLVPLLEELFWRGQLFGRLRPAFGFYGAALMSSVGFAAIHAEPGNWRSLLFLPIAFTFGVLVCTVREQTIFLAIGLHTLNNMVMGLRLWPLAALVAGGIATAGYIAISRAHRHRERTASPTPELAPDACADLPGDPARVQDANPSAPQAPQTWTRPT